MGGFKIIGMGSFIKYTNFRKKIEITLWTQGWALKPLEPHMYPPLRKCIHKFNARAIIISLTSSLFLFTTF